MNQGSGWCALWQSNESDLWDRGKPSPPLIELVEQRGDLIQSRADNGRRKKALVPVRSCNVDTLLFAEFPCRGADEDTMLSC